MKLFDILQHLSCACCNAVKRGFGNVHRHTRLTVDELVKALDKRTATCQCYSLVNDIGSQLRGSFLQSGLDSLNNMSERLSQSFSYLNACYGDVLGETVEKISSLYLHFLLAVLPVGRESGADGDLHIFGCALAYEQIVFFS